MNVGAIDACIIVAAAFQAARQLCRTPVVKHALRNPVTPGDDCHSAAFGFYLRQQRRLLLSRPLPPPLNPRDDLHIRHMRLLLELQKQAPEAQSIADPQRRRYTSEAGRLRLGGGHAAR
jgi:hypothetical protein